MTETPKDSTANTEMANIISGPVKQAIKKGNLDDAICRSFRGAKRQKPKG